MSTTTSARLEPRITASPCRIIISRVTGTRGLEPVHHHAERVADQDEIAVAVEQAGGMRVVGGEGDDRLAALAGPDMGAVSRLISSCTDICPKNRTKAYPRRLGPRRFLPAEDSECRPRGDGRPGRARDKAACRSRARSCHCAGRRTGIGGAPGSLRARAIRSRSAQAQNRAEQHDRAEIAVRNEVSHGKVFLRQPASMLSRARYCRGYRPRPRRCFSPATAFA